MARKLLILLVIFGIFGILTNAKVLNEEHTDENASDRFCSDQTSWVYCTAINIFDICSVNILSWQCQASCGKCKCPKNSSRSDLTPK